MRKMRRLAAASAALVAAALLAACSGGASGGDGAPGERVTLKFWSWVPNIDKVVAVWNREHPDVQVKVSDHAQGEALVTKLLASHKAGTQPDLAQVEYQALPSLIVAGAVADISKQVKGNDDAFPRGAWQLVRFSGRTYAVPQDFAPMMLYYRSDIFDTLGLSVPATWDQFANVAAEVRRKDPHRHLTTFSSGDPGWFAGLAQQAGASWWSVDGDRWQVQVNDAATRKVAEYWERLVDRGLVDDQPMYTPGWNKALNDGTLIAWPSAVWGPAVLEGIAPSTRGKWRMAPLPAWTSGDQRVGFWGGSSTAVMDKSPHKKQAARFAMWLNTDKVALRMLIQQSTVYPAATRGQSSDALATAPAFLPNQPDFYATVGDISGDATGFTWGPNVNVTYGAYKDAFGKALKSKSSFADALREMQAATVRDMKKSGFSVS